MNPSLVPTNHTRKARNETKTWINYQAHRSVGGSREAPSAPSANQSLTPPPPGNTEVTIPSSESMCVGLGQESLLTLPRPLPTDHPRISTSEASAGRNVLSRTFVLGKYVTFGANIRFSGLQRSVVAINYPSLAPLARLHRKLFCLSASVRPLSPRFPLG